MLSFKVLLPMAPVQTTQEFLNGTFFFFFFFYEMATALPLEMCICEDHSCSKVKVNTNNSKMISIIRNIIIV